MCLDFGQTGGEGQKRPVEVSERSGRDSRTQRRECEESFFGAFLPANRGASSLGPPLEKRPGTSPLLAGFVSTYSCLVRSVC